MFMSMGEVLVIILIAILLIKPKDIPIIIDKVKDCAKFFRKLKAEIFSHFDNELNAQDKLLQDEFEQVDRINFYLEKIIQIEGKYEGNYDIDSIKDKYFALNNTISHNKDKI